MSRQWRWFREDRCTVCGDCLTKCPVLGLGQAEAEREVRALIAGDYTRTRAFNECTTCNVCDWLCPEQAEPYELILERWHEWSREHGLPMFARMVFPNEPENLWAGLYDLLPADERELLEIWEQRMSLQHDEIILTGFYTNFVPFLAQAEVLAGDRERMAGNEALWGCGGDTLKMGLLDHTERVVELIGNVFTSMGVRRVTCFMTAEAAMLADILPKRFGFAPTFEVETLDDLLRRRLETGAVAATHPLGARVTVHDNCLSRYLGGRSQENLRVIAEACGCSLVEMQHTGSCSLCCGWAATIPTLMGPRAGSPTRTLHAMLAGLLRRLREAERTGAEVLLTGCPACYLFLNMAAELNASRIEVLHPLELLERAAGRNPERRIRERVWDLLAVTGNLVVKTATEWGFAARFQPQLPDPSTPQPTEPTSSADLDRIRRISRMLRSRPVRNRFSRLVLGTGLRVGVSLSQLVLRLSQGRFRGN
jgi:glycolate oxidase iron-sulfur subunit